MPVRDGRIGPTRGTALWDTARRLAADPRVQAEGASAADWDLAAPDQLRKPAATDF